MAYIAMAYIVMAYIAMAYIAMAYIAMAYIAMAYIAMAYIVRPVPKKEDVTFAILFLLYFFPLPELRFWSVEFIRDHEIKNLLISVM